MFRKTSHHRNYSKTQRPRELLMQLSLSRQQQPDSLLRTIRVNQPIQKVAPLEDSIKNRSRPCLYPTAQRSKYRQGQGLVDFDRVGFMA